MQVAQGRGFTGHAIETEGGVYQDLTAPAAANETSKRVDDHCATADIVSTTRVYSWLVAKGRSIQALDMSATTDLGPSGAIREIRNAVETHPRRKR